MKCPNCGRKIKRGQAFCGSCGSAVPKRRKWPLVLWAIGALLLAFVIIDVMLALQIRSDYERLNTDNYEFDEEVLHEIDAKTSTGIPTVAELDSMIRERGFGDVDIFATYDLDGNLLDGEPLDKTKDDRYPLYTFAFVEDNGSTWWVYICNGSFEADPVFAYDAIDNPPLLTESGHLSAYNAEENVFLETMPEEHEARLIKVDAINAETLSQFSSIESLEAL